MNVFRRLRLLLRRHHAEAEMAEEMRFHLEQRAADYTAQGMSADNARHAAQRKFGNLGSLQERARDTWGWGWLERAAKDVRFAFRQLTNSPGYALLAVFTLGLGIGINTSMFTALNGMILKPLPYPAPDELDRFFRGTTTEPRGNFSPADFLDFQRARAGYGDVAAYTLTNTSLSEPGQPAEMAYASRATVNLFSLLGVTPQLGRDFRPEEAAPGRDHVVILSQRVWRNRYGGKPDVIGRTVRINGEPHEVIGVLPQSFNDGRHLGVIDFFRPLAFTPDEARDRADNGLRILGRRHRPDVEAAGYVANFGQRLAAEFPMLHADTTWRTVSLRLLIMGQNGKTIMSMLIGLSGFVLLLACSNLANLLLARTVTRAREFAVRSALGASRTQLLRPLIAESLLLALAGGGIAILFTRWFVDWAAVRSTADNGEQVNFPIDWHVTTWAAGAALFTALAFGLAPALFALRLDLNHTLKSGGRGTTGGLGHRRFRQFLIVGQFALAMVTLTGAGLFIRGLYDLNNRRAGWSTDNVVMASVLLPAAKYGDDEKVAAFHRLAAEQLATIPGVATVSVSSTTPFFNWSTTRRFLVEGQDRPAPGREPAASVNVVSPQYFETFGTPLLLGRPFTARDDATTGRVYIVSQSMARGLFGDANPIGRRLARATNDTPRWGEIVGVVQDVASVEAERKPTTFQIYEAMAQKPQRDYELALRIHDVAAATVVNRVRATMTALDPDLPLKRLQAAETTIYRTNYTLRVLRDILSAIAVCGLGLAALGVYGVMSRTLAQRAGEFAIRLALGASLGGLTRMILASGVKLALLGAAIGLLGACAVARILDFAYPNLHVNSLPVQLAVTLLLVAIALLACWLPARRAGKIDAMAVLRAE